MQSTDIYPTPVTGEINLTLPPPHPKQQLFLDSPADVVLFGGAVGGGKSYSLRRYAVEQCCNNPGIKVTLFRRRFRELRDTHVKKILDEYDNFFKAGLMDFNQSSLEVRFWNKSLFQMRFCEEENDVYTYKSDEWDILLIDEVTHFSENQYIYLSSRTRSSAGFKTKIRISCNPEGIGLAWVKRRFIDKLDNFDISVDPETRLTMQFIPSFLKDNPSIDYDSYIKMLRMLPEHKQRALIDGSWDVYEGMVFSEWREQDECGNPYHVIPYSPPKPEWVKFRTIDWGFTRPSVCLWIGVDKEGRCFLYREVCRTQMRDEDFAALIQSSEEPDELITQTFIDPSCWFNGRGKNQWGIPIAEAYDKCGLKNLIKGCNDRISGWQRIHEMLAPMKDGLPGLQIMDNCRNIIRNLPAAVYEQSIESKKEDVDSHCMDDELDALRYFASSRAKYFNNFDADEYYEREQANLNFKMAHGLTGYN